MRYRGNRRHSRGAGRRRLVGRHRRPKERSGARARRRRRADRRAAAPAPAQGRARPVPQDRARGRARAARRGRATRPYGAMTSLPNRRYTWRDFELDEDLPRAAPHPAGRGRPARRPAPLRGAGGHPVPPVGRGRPLGAAGRRTRRRQPRRAARRAQGEAGRRAGRDLCRVRRCARPGRHAVSARGTAAVRQGYVGHLRRGVRRSDDRRRRPAVTDARRDVARDRPRARRHRRPDRRRRPRQWQSDSAEFRALYEQCLPHFASDFHLQAGDLGRHEFFADAFAAIASRQRPALVDMLGGNTRVALNVMLFFNRKYGI